MEQNITNIRSKRHSKQDIMQLLDEFTEARTSVEQFCSRHSIGRSTFHKWQSRYRNKADEQSATAFADIRIIDSKPSAVLFAEVNGIRLFQPVAAAYLKELLP